MKQFIKTMCVLTLISGLVFSANSRVLKSEFKKNRMNRVEPDYRRGEQSTRAACPHQYPNNPQTVVTVIDSSANGYGMVSTVTRPMDVNSDGNMLVVYRQYAGENTTHGQLGAGYGVVTDGDVEWDVQYNVNSNGNPPWDGGGVGGSGTAQARYPSGIAAEQFPYAIWNEYTGNVAGWPADCSSYGGRPYFSYDEFEWGGESWLYPAELDQLYDCEKDLWTGSVAYGQDAGGEDHVVVVYDDWTRTGSYQFTSEAVDNGFIVLGTETLIVNPQHLGTDGYSSAAILSMNDNGQGLLGVDGIFAGVDMDADACGLPASNLTCDKTPMFKLTDDYGENWYGNRNAYDFYYVPENVFEQIFSLMPTEDIDACTGEVSVINDYWSWYEFDMRVDKDGNPHIVISIIAESDNYFHFLDGYTGFYHLTIDRDRLDSDLYDHDNNSQWINTADGWNWSYVPLPANDSFEWNRPDGYSYLYGAMTQISLSRDSDVVYMVANIATEGPMDPALDTNGDGVEDDPCGTQNNPWELYPEWSEDIWVARSQDNGSTWTTLDNLTQTPRDPNNTGENNCQPEEQYVHTAHWSDDQRVYFQYNQPNWEFNEIGDPLGADCMNRVFLGYAWVEYAGEGGCTDVNNCSYDPTAAFDNGSCGVGLYECANGSFGCGCDGACGDGLDAPAVEDCNGVCGGPALSTCSEICSTAYCGVATSICTESAFSQGTCTQINSWTDCDGVSCGGNDPLFGCDGRPTCDGGRCYFCEGGTCTGSETDDVACSACSGQWNVETAGGCDDSAPGCADVHSDEAACDAVNRTWEWFVDSENNGTANTNDDGDGVSNGRSDECYCAIGNYTSSCSSPADADVDGNIDSTSDCPSTTTVGGQTICTGTITTFSDGDGYCDVEPTCGDGYCNGAETFSSCPEDGCLDTGGDCTIGDLNADGSYNVLDIVALANCVLSATCVGCQGDMNGDGSYNVLDIVALANCVLSATCGTGRVASDVLNIDDATEATFSIEDNHMYITGDGVISGVQMTLQHDLDFVITMTDRAYLADYLTEGNQTRLLVINPETDALFSYKGDFEITETIVANSQGEISATLPVAATFSVRDVYPNPFNPTTQLDVSMPLGGEIKVGVYNLLGQMIATLASGYMDAGNHTFVWDASNVASGTYFMKIEADGFVQTQKLMLVK